MTGRVAADLHVHSALSPCGDEAMRPPAVLLRAEQLGIGIIGIVDHSAARNAAAFMSAAEAFDVRVLVGLEVESAEGVHILTLFGNAEDAMAMDARIAETLPPLRNRPEFFGEQFLLDEMGDISGTDERLLAAASSLGIEEIALVASELGGISIPAHVDRGAAGLIRTLGFVPPGLKAQAFEVSAHTSIGDARRRWPDLAGRPLLTNSDAHCVADISRAVTWLPAELAEHEFDAERWGATLAQELAGGGVARQ